MINWLTKKLFSTYIARIEALEAKVAEMDKVWPKIGGQ